jgi:hypothetical protein
LQGRVRSWGWMWLRRLLKVSGALFLGFSKERVEWFWLEPELQNYVPILANGWSRGKTLILTS